MTSFQRLNIAAGAFLLWHLTAISNSLSSLWDQLGLQHKVFAFTVGNGQQFNKTCHIDPIICPFSKFLQQQIQGYSLWSVSHIFQPSEFLNPACLLEPTSHPASTPQIVPAILGRPPLAENHSSTPPLKMRATLLGAKASTLTVIDLTEEMKTYCEMLWSEPTSCTLSPL